MVESKLSFLEMQIEGSFGQAVELGHTSLCIAPEALDAIDVTFATGELVGTMIDSKMLVKADIDQPIVTRPAIRMNHRAGSMWPRIMPCSVAFEQSGTICV